MNVKFFGIVAGVLGFINTLTSNIGKYRVFRFISGVGANRVNSVPVVIGNR